ncbi:hypothetical protein [Wolbachia pipientis]|uniref:hypothetical protein n=1 Tax=Wolbachia pipientis TaxID=955 RepID=UPI0025A44ED5|nr:hypothetical protein [Wolbachia pipientis]MDM8335283.1 hypothetical protein [Wolbachia pipientis]
MTDHSYGVEKVLNDFSQRLRLKLERVGNDYKLILITSSDEPYYYYYGKSSNRTIDNNIETIGCIPQNFTCGQDVRVYDYDTCSIEFKPPESSKVLIDPKDITSSQNISLILENLKTSPDNRLKIRAGENFFKESRFVHKAYKSVELHDYTVSKVGILNNVVQVFDRRDVNFKLFPFYETDL